MKEMNPKLSQIILYVDQKYPREDICAFRTNILQQGVVNWFTYLCYVNENDTEESFFMELQENIKVSSNEIIVITDSKEAMKYLERNKIAFACVQAESSEDFYGGASYALEDLKYIQYDFIKKVWQRFHSIPWTISETERLIIREQTINDVDRIFEIYSDEEVKKYMEPLKNSKEEEISYIRDYIKYQYGFYEFGIWVLVEKNTGRIIGRAGLSIREGFDGMELGYVIEASYRRQGYAREACEGIIRYLTEYLEESEIFALTMRGNVAGIGLLESLGFTKCEDVVAEGRNLVKHRMIL